MKRLLIFFAAALLMIDANARTQVNAHAQLKNGQPLHLVSSSGNSDAASFASRNVLESQDSLWTVIIEVESIEVRDNDFDITANVKVGNKENEEIVKTFEKDFTVSLGYDEEYVVEFEGGFVAFRASN
jgi:hypothetical protein